MADAQRYAKRYEITTGELIEMYKSGLSTMELSERTGISQHALRWRLEHAGFKLRSRGEAIKLAFDRGRRKHHSYKGNLHPNWKGGRYKTNHGYIKIWMPEHPRARNSTVWEHLLVWEQHNGQSLPEGWVIHHLNGVRDDNRPENLVALPKKVHAGEKPSRLLIAKLRQRVRDLEAQLSQGCFPAFRKVIRG